jgi:hypothetical protein
MKLPPVAFQSAAAGG